MWNWLKVLFGFKKGSLFVASPYCNIFPGEGEIQYQKPVTPSAVTVGSLSRSLSLFVYVCVLCLITGEGSGVLVSGAKLHTAIIFALNTSQPCCQILHLQLLS